jgi:hypothetical protein
MVNYDASAAECLVYTYKTGWLSRLAHDLKHRVTRFALAIDEQASAIHAAVDARSLRVVCAMQGGMETHDELSAGDRRRIEGQMVDGVLHARANPLITFRSTSVRAMPEGFAIDGMLELNSYVRPITTIARRLIGAYVADLRLHQPDFGIEPFSSLLGALQIKPDVMVRIVVPSRLP